MNAVANYMAQKHVLDELRKILDTAILRRPMYPYTWAQKADIKTYLEEFDQERSTAIDNALKYGGGDPDLVDRMISL